MSEAADWVSSCMAEAHAELQRRIAEEDPTGRFEWRLDIRTTYAEEGSNDAVVSLIATPSAPALAVQLWPRPDEGEVRPLLAARRDPRTGADPAPEGYDRLRGS